VLFTSAGAAPTYAFIDARPFRPRDFPCPLDAPGAASRAAATVGGGRLGPRRVRRDQPTRRTHRELPGRDGPRLVGTLRSRAVRRRSGRRLGAEPSAEPASAHADARLVRRGWLARGPAAVGRRRRGDPGR